MRSPSVFSWCLSLVIVSVAVAQNSPDLAWAQSIPVYGTAGAVSIVALQNGNGYALAGSCGANSLQAQNDVVFLAKTDLNGNPNSKVTIYDTYNNPVNIGSHDVSSVLQDAYGDLILVGTRKAHSHHSQNTNAWILCVNSCGAVKWQTAFGGMQGEQFTAQCAMIMKNGDIVIGGQKDSNAWIGCLGDDGQTKWSNTYAGEKILSLYQIAYSSSGNYYATSVSKINSSNMLNIYCMDWQGTLLSNQVGSLPKLKCNQPVLNSTGDMNSFFAAKNPDNNACTIIAFGRDGEKEWNKELLFGNGGNVSISALASYADNFRLIGGDREYGPADGPKFMWVAGVDSIGNEQWFMSYTAAQSICALLPCPKNHSFIAVARNPGSKNNLSICKFSFSEDRNITAAALVVQNRKNALGQPIGANVYDVQGRKIALSQAGQLPHGLFYSRIQSNGNAGTMAFQIIRK